VKQGVSALDLIDSNPVSVETFAKAKAILEQVYGVDYPKEKMMILFQLIDEEGWSEERFNRVFKWFLKTKYNQSWTIADWFQYDVKLYPFAWVRQHCHENGLREDVFIRSLDCYNVGGVRMYKMKDGVDLPFPSGDTVMPMPYKGSY
jgi:hypothetical protein